MTLFIRDRTTKTKVRIFNFGIFIVVFSLLIYVDFGIISPNLLPTDPCYYHTNPTPFWVDFFYMNGSSNGHPEWSIMHIILLIALSAFIVRLFEKKIFNESCRKTTLITISIIVLRFFFRLLNFFGYNAFVPSLRGTKQSISQLRYCTTF